MSSDDVRFNHFHWGSGRVTVAHRVVASYPDRVYGSMHVETVEFAAAYCAPGDQFSRKHGRRVAAGRLRVGRGRRYRVNILVNPQNYRHSVNAELRCWAVAMAPRVCPVLRDMLMAWLSGPSRDFRFGEHLDFLADTLNDGKGDRRRASLLYCVRRSVVPAFGTLWRGARARLDAETSLVRRAEAAMDILAAASRASDARVRFAARECYSYVLRVGGEDKEVGNP